MATITLGKTNEIPEGSGKCFEVEGRPIAVFNIDGAYFAIDDQCTHAEASLSEGEIEGTVVTCPWHGAMFDVRTGEALSAPAFEGVQRYDLHIENGEIRIVI